MAGSYFRAQRSLATALGPLFRPQPQLARNAPRRLVSSSAPRPSTTGRNLLITGILTATAGISLYYATDTRASFHQWLVPRLIRTFFPDAEDAHHIGTVALKALYPLGLHPRERPTPGSESTDPAEMPIGLTRVRPKTVTASGFSAGSVDSEPGVGRSRGCRPSG